VAGVRFRIEKSGDEFDCATEICHAHALECELRDYIYVSERNFGFREFRKYYNSVLEILE
jgi:hypothetical protein